MTLTSNQGNTQAGASTVAMPYIWTCEVIVAFLRPSVKEPHIQPQVITS